jgi:hypothetical protein
MNTNTPAKTPDRITRSLTDDDIERMLREDATRMHEAYIDNDGFSERVMQDIVKLPVPRGLSAHHRIMIVAATTIGGLLLVMFAGHGNDYLIDAVMDFATQTLTPTLLAVLVVAVLGAVFGITAAADAR